MQHTHQETEGILKGYGYYKRHEYTYNEWRKKHLDFFFLISLHLTTNIKVKKTNIFKAKKRAEKWMEKNDYNFKMQRRMMTMQGTRKKRTK